MEKEDNVFESFIYEIGGDDGTAYFVNPTYVDAIQGVTTDNRIVYSYEKMVQYLMEHEYVTEEEAIDYIDYNCIRSLGYMGDHSPIIMYERNVDEYILR